MARPTKINPETLEKLKQALSIGATLKMACSFSNIGYSTFFKWRKIAKEAILKKEEGKRLSKQEKNLIEFEESIKTAEVQGAIKALARLQKAAQEGEWKVDAWLLERRWNYTRHNSIQTEQEEELTLEPKKLLIQQLQQLQQASVKAMAMGSFQAYAALQRQQINCIMQLKSLEREEGTEMDQMTDEDLLDQISNIILGLPPILRQRLNKELDGTGKVVSIKGR